MSPLYISLSLTCFVILIILVFIQVKQLTRTIRIKRWYRSLNLEHHARIFNQLFQNVDGFALSRKDRQVSDAFEYVYGEIEFLSFIALLSLARPNSDTVFYDLGSGTGKAVLACALVYRVKKSVGVELLPHLHSSASEQLEHLEAITDVEINTPIEFIQGNFLEVNLGEATYIFINSTGLFGPTWESLCCKLDKLPNLKTVITTSKPLQTTVFSLVQSTKIQMSWGVVIAYIHSRKN